VHPAIAPRQGEQGGGASIKALSQETALTRSQPHPVDLHVGSRLRLARTSCGLSQEELASTIGVSFQQIQKYERGSNRISASALFRFCTRLSTPIDWFFEGLDAPTVRMAEADPLSTFLALDEAREPAALMARLPLELRRRLVALIRVSASPADMA